MRFILSLILVIAAFARGFFCRANEQGPVCKQCFSRRNILVLISKFLTLGEYQKFFEANPRKKNTMKDYLQQIGLEELIYEFETRARRAIPITSFGKFPLYATMLSKKENKFIGGSETAFMLLDQPNGRSSYVFLLDYHPPLDEIPVLRDDDCPICMDIPVDPILVYSCGHVFCARCALKWIDYRIVVHAGFPRSCPACLSPIAIRGYDLADVNSLFEDIDFLLQHSDNSSALERFYAHRTIMSIANDARVSNGATKGVLMIADEKKTLIILRF
jgi:hypothetical protein